MNLLDGLLLLFVGLKLTGYIEWNWFLVCLPAIVNILIGFMKGIARTKHPPKTHNTELIKSYIGLRSAVENLIYVIKTKDKLPDDEEKH